MNAHMKKLIELERRLFFAFRAEESAAPGVGWQESVMNDVRRLRNADARVEGRVLFGAVAWRFSTAACVVALLLLAYVLSTGIIDYQELTVRYLENPIDFII